eukprot:2608250-Rhodomonas_salina.3
MVSSTSGKSRLMLLKVKLSKVLQSQQNKIRMLLLVSLSIGSEASASCRCLTSRTFQVLSREDHQRGGVTGTHGSNTQDSVQERLSGCKA